MNDGTELYEKDFAACGMRLGCVISQNKEFNKAIRALCLAATLLEDQEFIRKFLAKSHTLLLRNRLLAEELLKQAGIDFYDKGNAGFFIWIDLSPHLRSENTEGDAWAAERLLSGRFAQAGVIMSTGEQYQAQEPGRFRIIFCVDEETLREGIRRLVQCA
ncbi:acc synthase [Penicillium waksmanii]|uniref:acc synthase n=1 Tax=Penicillium waksmanii TaxID=69791 RepID=UPI0025477206|nr:acc synthase [Penicillium waksmanii]KAJ5995755.1 acc synthase [Penicillium waksmanii]